MKLIIRGEWLGNANTLLLFSLICTTCISVTLTQGQSKVNEKICKELPAPKFLLPKQLPLTALASFQGSGNTWVRQILAGATGYKTGDIYLSYGDDEYPEFSSAHNDSVLAIKTHTFSASSSDDFQFRRALVIARHPLDALYSEFNRVYGGNKTGYAEKFHLVNTDGSLTWKWDTWMTHITSWIDFYKYWIKVFPGKAYIIYYNNLKHRTFSELEGAIRFLGLEPDYVRLNCTIKFPKPAYFKRTNTPPPVDKKTLFRFSISKADKAIGIFKQLIFSEFGAESETYKRFNLDISVKDLL